MRNFIDEVRIFCQSGRGGAGSMHLLRDKISSKGGPDGGDGGRGGHIILRGNSHLWTLLHLKYKRHFKATPGEGGSGQKKHGADGKDIIIEVPLGTIGKTFETREKEIEILEHGQEEIWLEGGQGGLGNSHFKSSVNQTPRYAQPGQDGTEDWKLLELKILADVGLVGFPNAGKSTLLANVSAAKPKIADYPFTTLVPQLGIVSYRDDQSFVMADIPGIIEKAHEGKGLGHRFLRHIERNAVLLFMISCESDTIMKDYEVLLEECKLFSDELMSKDKIIVVTKIDLMDDEMIADLKKEIKTDLPIHFISSVSQKGIPALKDSIWKMLNTPA